MITCGRCGKTNPPGVLFCQHCGTRQAADVLPADARCGACGTTNPPGTNFCQGCGVRLGAASPTPGRGLPAQPALPVQNRPTAGSQQVSGMIGGPPSYGGPLDLSAATPPAPMPIPAARAGPGLAPAFGPPAAEAPRALARFVAVRRDGSDGASYPFSSEQIDMGRGEGDLIFDDPHLARRHVRVCRQGAEWTIAPLETRNGIYLRLRRAVDLADGDHVLLGKQVLRFELVPEVEKNIRPAVEHGVVYFGTPVKAPWARLRQLTASGTTRDVYHLTRPEIVLGREQGDIVFSDDEFLSRRHAQIAQRGGRPVLEDLGSSNGTFHRLRTAHPLSHGDMVRMGDELLRFELL